MKKRINVPFKVISTERLLTTSGVNGWSHGYSGAVHSYKEVLGSKLREINVHPKGRDFEEGESHRLPEHMTTEERQYVEPLEEAFLNALRYESMMADLRNYDTRLYDEVELIVDSAIKSIAHSLKACGHIEEYTHGEKQGRKASGECMGAYNEIENRGYDLLSLKDDEGFNPSYNETANLLFSYFCRIYSDNSNKIPTIKNIEKRLRKEVPINHNPKK
jgi:hypothetical protein